MGRIDRLGRLGRGLRQGIGGFLQLFLGRGQIRSGKVQGFLRLGDRLCQSRDDFLFCLFTGIGKGCDRLIILALGRFHGLLGRLHILLGGIVSRLGVGHGSLHCLRGVVQAGHGAFYILQFGDHASNRALHGIRGVFGRLLQGTEDAGGQGIAE